MDEQERRDDPRTNCDIAALVELSDRVTVPVSVENLSATGVRMQVAESAHLPKTLNLLISDGDGVVQRYRVKILWRSGDMVGGEFVFFSSDFP